MKIKVMGKINRKGTSKKTGNPYDFNQIHYLGYEQGVEGTACLVQNIDKSLIPLADIVIGADYNIDFNGRGFVVGFSIIPPNQAAHK